jgi:L-glyceraldehyde 3-phosphate reductase
MSNTYLADSSRYDKMIYNHVGKSGLKLPALSLGLWQNFGDYQSFDVQQAVIRKAFDSGITHFDLANNYGPRYGAAEKNFSRIFTEDLRPYRDELIISSKAGYDMWPGPYGDGGSRKYIISSADQSLTRLSLDYVDIFYSHRRDETTPLEETALALDHLVKTGKTLYVGVSNYSAEDTIAIAKIFEELHTPFIIHQPRYNMLDRHIEPDLKPALTKLGLGGIAFSPLEQGILTDRYLDGIPADSRVFSTYGSLKADTVNEKIEKVRLLNEIAKHRGQTMAGLAISWILRDGVITSVLIGASRVSQLEDNLKALDNIKFSDEEIKEIDAILK